MTRISRILGWLLLAALVVATVVPIGLRPVTEAPVSPERFGAFALLEFLFALGYPRRRRRVLAVVILAAAGLEALQMVEVTRHGRMTDFLVKGMGGSLGVAMAMGLAFVPAIGAKVRGSREAGG
ncbi:MAG: VanZ family protein [Methylorubrum rhodinum]|uniref:VanZ family protein n=1 Tax=Methylorubrum rhodinum TaxID=29428 RepID=UPI003BAFD2AB